MVCDECSFQQICCLSHIQLSLCMYIPATEAHDHDGLPHTLEHLVFMGSELYPYKVRDCPDIDTPTGALCDTSGELAV